MSEHRCQTEIWNFENVIFCQQKIFRFDVAMGYPTVMQKILKIKKKTIILEQTLQVDTNFQGSE